MLKDWDDIPEGIKNNQVLSFYKILRSKKLQLYFKRLFDLVMALILIIILLPLFIIIAVLIKIDSKGPIMYRQIRVTQYGRKFSIFKFRTMVNNADKIGAKVTTLNDLRITRIGLKLRKLRLDEIPQLFNIVLGDMSFVGTRPEVTKYVQHYTDEMMATLLLPAGVTSEASIHYKDEENLLADAHNADEVYINEILPEKMIYNLKSIESFSFIGEIKTMLKTLYAVINSNKESRSLNGNNRIDNSKENV